MKYLVASTSRCGSSMMKQYLVRKFPGESVGHNHTPPQPHFRGKAIFMFCHPLNTVVTKSRVKDGKVFTRMQRAHWNKQAPAWKFSAPRGDGVRYFGRNVEVLENLFASWYKPLPFPHMIARYETLWDNLDKIGEFFGISIDDFPEYVPRQTDWRKHPDAAKLEKEFATIIKTIDEAEDIKIWQ